MLICFHCGHDIVPGKEQVRNNITYCKNCYEDMTTCDKCSRLIHSDESRDFDGKFLCEECYQSLPECSYCEEPYDPDDEEGIVGMCPYCARHHFVCDGCEQTRHVDYHGRDGLCIDCFNDNENKLIKDYHSGPDCDITFYPNRSCPLYFGIELETDNYKDREKASAQLTEICDDDRLFWLEEDSSLSNGIEIITQPCTLAYHCNEFPWREIVKIVEKQGGKSHDTTTCGLHIHFNRSFFAGHSELYRLRLIYLFERFWSELVVFSRRKLSEVQHNANKYGCYLFDCSAKKKIEELGTYGRYQAVNISKGHTIEIRMFKGSLTVTTILASIELVDYLVRLAKRTSTRQLQEMTWATLVKGTGNKKYRYLSNYLEERNLCAS